MKRVCRTVSQEVGWRLTKSSLVDNFDHFFDQIEKNLAHISYIIIFSSLLLSILHSQCVYYSIHCITVPLTCTTSSTDTATCACMGLDIFL